MRTPVAVALAVLLLAPLVAEARTRPSPRTVAGERSSACRALVAASGPTIRLRPAQAGSLSAIVSRAAPGTTLLLADGTYRLGSTLIVSSPGLTIRSLSGRPEAVVLDGNYATGDLVAVAASDVTIAEMTLTRTSYHLVHVVPRDAGPTIRRARLYRLRLVDGAQQFVKVNPNAARSAFADAGRVECSSFRLTDRGRPHIPSNFLPCYTGGIDAHGARGWVVRLNRFEDLRCADGLAEHAVHFWTGSRDTLVERNTIVDCARGIGFGLGESTDWARTYQDAAREGYVGHYGGIIRNNVVIAGRPGMDTGIGLEQARGARIYHNTVYAGRRAARYFSSLDYRFPSTSADIRNNLVTRITARDGARATLDRNVESVPASWFRNPSRLDFHLRPTANEAIDRGVSVDAAGLDIDGTPHTVGLPDLGADEAGREPGFQGSR
jgi:hypothetical protein